jgi:hypothetical protein
MIKLTDKALDRASRALALACNGGDWDTHYTNTQKDLWRKRVMSALGYEGK